MIRWLRVTLPYWEIPAALLLIVHVISGIVQWFDGGSPLQRLSGTEPMAVVLTGLAIVYGQMRVASFHPVWRTDYFDWLRHSPWCPDRPLPGGPVMLVPQDGVIVGVMTFSGWWFGSLSNEVWKFIPAAFLVSWLFDMVITLRLCGLWGYTYAILTGLGVAIWCFPHPELTSAALTLTTVLTGFGLRKSWRTFPWPIERMQRSLKRLKAAMKGQTVFDGELLEPDALGWPFQLLNPNQDRAHLVPFPDALLGSLTGGWLLYAVASHWDLHQAHLISYVAACAVVGKPLLIWRLVEYFQGVASPVTFWGRLWTLRWLIWRFDCAFLAPLMSVGMALGGMGLLLRLPQLVPAVPTDLVAAVWFAGLLQVLLIRTPHYRQWRLTAPLRLKPQFQAHGQGTNTPYVKCQ